MKPDEQQRVHERMREWIKLTPEQRRVVRENYARSKKIEPGKKSAQWEQYQQLPEDQKKKLAADAATRRRLLANLPSESQDKAKGIPPNKKPGIFPLPPMPPAAPAVPGTATPATGAPPAAAPVNNTAAPSTATPASPVAPSNAK